MSTEIKTTLALRKNLATCRDEECTRYALASAEVTTTQQGTAYVCTSNGHVASLAITSAEGQAIRTLCPAEMFERVPRGKITATLNGRWERSDGRFAEAPAGRFPRMPDIFAKSIESDRLEDYTAFTLNPDLLTQLAEAIRRNEKDASLALTIFIPRDPTRWAHGCPIVGEAGIGVLMPCHESKPEDETRVQKARLEQYRATAENYRNATEAAELI